MTTSQIVPTIVSCPKLFISNNPPQFFVSFRMSGTPIDDQDEDHQDEDPSGVQPFQEAAGTKRSMPSNNKKPRPPDASSMILTDLSFDMFMELYGSVPFPQLLRHRAACKKFSQILLLAAVRIELDKSFGAKNTASLLFILQLAIVLPQCVALQHLNLRGNGTYEGAALLAVALPQCASLMHLNLEWNGIGAEGAALLAVALPQCASLQHLNLTGNKIRASGAASLAVALPRCAALQHLNLGYNNIGNEGVASLGAVAAECLTKLDIRFNFIYDHDGILAAWLLAGKWRHGQAQWHLQR